MSSEKRNFRIIDEATTGGYEWATFAVLRGADGLLYTDDQSGCSCNYFGYLDLNPSPANNWHEVVKRVRAWRDECDGWFDGAGPAAEALIERLSKDRPKKRDPKQFAELAGIGDW